MAGISHTAEEKYDKSVTDNVSSEIATLKAMYGEECKILENVGEYRYVVNMRPKALDFSIKFQLTDMYPTEAPVIFISSKTMNARRNDPLLIHLHKIATNATVTSPESLLHNLYASALAWLDQRGVDLSIQDVVSTHSPKRKNKAKKKSNVVEKEESSEKKPSMKTASDVIKRIQWDPNVSAESFVVGYIDRFIGIQEKAFSAFSWEDIASVDYETLAIPKHRIEYFKYEGVKVWDKNERLDHVFGSTGSGITLVDVISKLQATGNGSGGTAAQNTNLHSDDEEDDDEDIDVNIKLSEDDAAENGAKSAKEEYWGEKLRPNYFLALRITDPEIIKQATHAQDLILETNPVYAECCIPPEKLHMTVCCLGLDTEEQIATCVSVLRDLEPELSAMKPTDIEVTFNGADNFFLNTIYAKVEPNRALQNFVEHIKVCMAQAGVSVRDVFDFVPHMTLMKFSRHLQRLHHTKFVDPRLFELVKDIRFGTQVFNNIHLCSMSAETSCDGFYVCPTTMFFQ